LAEARVVALGVIDGPVRIIAVSEGVNKVGVSGEGAEGGDAAVSLREELFVVLIGDRTSVRQMHGLGWVLRAQQGRVLNDGVAISKDALFGQSRSATAGLLRRGRVIEPLASTAEAFARRAPAAKTEGEATIADSGLGITDDRIACIEGGKASKGEGQ